MAGLTHDIASAAGILASGGFQIGEGAGQGVATLLPRSCFASVPKCTISCIAKIMTLKSSVQILPKNFFFAAWAKIAHLRHLIKVCLTTFSRYHDCI